MLCEEKFVWLNSLKRHMQLHDDLDSRTFSCPVCPRFFDSADAMDDHMRLHADSLLLAGEFGKESRECFAEFRPDAAEFCSRSGELRPASVEIQSVSGELRPDSAEFCFKSGEVRSDSGELPPNSSKFHSDSTTALPDESISNRKPPELDGKKTVTDAWIRRHLRPAGGRRRNECLHCGRCYPTMDSLQKHVKIHSGVKKYVCAECGSRFLHMSHLRVHMRIHSEEMRYACSICGQKFLWQNSLKRHLWRHGPERERSHACSVCAKTFHTAYQLRLHARTHTNDRPYMCQRCGRRYTSRSSLSCHQTHSHFARPQSCPECGKQCKSERVVRQHVRMAHRAPLYQCPHCEMEFRQQSWLDCHLLCHSTQQPYFCDECQLSNTITNDTDPSVSLPQELVETLPSQHPGRDPDPSHISVVKQASDGEMNAIAALLVNSATAFLLDNSSPGNSTTAAGDWKNPGGNILASNDTDIGAECDGDAAAGKDSEPGAASSNGEPSSEQYGNCTAPSDDSEFDASVTEDGTRLSNMAREAGDDNELAVTNAATFSTISSPVQDEVCCVRCQKIQLPQRCPVCQQLFPWLPGHIGAHCGRNPYTISSLLGIQSTYRDEDPGGEGAERGDGGAAVLRKRHRKRSRVPKQCTICGRTYAKLAEHMVRMHGNAEPYMCTDCGKFLRSANSLRAHMTSRTCLKSRVCPICERTCENDAGLKSHLRSHMAADEDMKEYRCDECSHTFSSSEALQAHTALHASGKHHVCCICGRKFIHARSLRLHIRTHTGETPYECRICRKGFRSRKGLAEHRSVHTMERKYGCAMCGRRFRLHRTYSRHLVLHSGVKRFRCEQCGMRFAFNHLRKRHMRTHSGEKPYVCVDCGDRFTQWNGLSQHRRRRCGRESDVFLPLEQTLGSQLS